MRNIKLTIFVSALLLALTVQHVKAFEKEDRADVSELNIGLFLDAPDWADKDSDNLLNFSAYVDGTNYAAGVSARFGSFVFGFETRHTDRLGSLSGGILSANNDAGLSGSSSPVADTTHRLMLGMVLNNKSVVYGFGGLSNRSARLSMSYASTQQASITREETYESGTQTESVRVGEEEVQYVKGYDRCDRPIYGTKTIGIYETRTTTLYDIRFVEDTTDITSSGDVTQNFENLGLVFGGGFEQALLGGLLRFEYTMTQFDGAKALLAINNLSGDETIAASSTSLKDVSWDKMFEHQVKLRFVSQF